MHSSNTGKLKYIHIMSHKSLIYNAQIVNMINENKEQFSKEEHLFVISDSEVYEQVKKYNNTVWVKDISTNIRQFKNYANKCEYIFLHSNTLSTKILLFLNNKTLNKIIWCEWGHDLYNKEKYIRKKRIQKFYAIGIGFQYDAIEAKRKYGSNMKIVMTPYGYKKDNQKKIDEIIENSKMEKDYKKIMIGHSAYEFLNHIDLLHKLSKYRDENIKISLVLAYGCEEYAEKVKNEAIMLFGKEKVEIIDKLMSQEEYIKYLSTVDICLLDYKHQSALGNIYYLLYMGKKLFLNKNGVIKLFTILENIETYNTDEIECMNYEEFSKKVLSPKYGKQFAEFHISEKNYVELWKNTISELKKNNRGAKNG